jgi:hypothetical protein
MVQVTFVMSTEVETSLDVSDQKSRSNASPPKKVRDASGHSTA